MWCYQDQSVLTRNFDQQDQVLKGVRIDSVRYMDSWGKNPMPDNEWERGKEGSDGVVYGDGYPQEDYFELAQVYTPVAIGEASDVKDGALTFAVENRFDFIPLHGHSLRWQLKSWQQVLGEGTVWLSAKARETETVSIPLADGKTGKGGILVMQVLRPDGSLCYEKHVRLSDETDYRQLLVQTECKTKDKRSSILQLLPSSAFLLRVGRPLDISLDYRRKGLWMPYLLKPVSVKTKKQKDGYHITCRWQRDGNVKSYIDGDITVAIAKNGMADISYTLTPGDSIGGKFLDYGLAFSLPADYDQVAWLGQGPFSQTPDKTAYNNYDTWQLHRDDIRFYGNRADVDLMAVLSPQAALMLCSDNRNLHLENVDGRIVVTDNLVVGIYGTKFTSPAGIDANKLGQRQGRLTLLSCPQDKAGEDNLPACVFGQRRDVNPEQPYLKSYGK